MRNSNETVENRSCKGYEAESPGGDALARPWTSSSKQQFEGECETGAR